jgi:hypothetical protein
MGAARFKNNGDIKVEAGVKKVKVTLSIKWNDAGTFGFALLKASMNQEGKEFNWERSLSNESGSATRSVTLFANPDSGKEWSITYIKATEYAPGGGRLEQQTTPSGTSGEKTIYFYDTDGNDKNAVIEISLSDIEYYTATETPTPPGDTFEKVGPDSCSPPIPWESLLPICGSPPSGTSSSDGLQISKTGQNQITLNLKNYANKLVSLKITHQQDSAWAQSFNFNIPNCSDISPNTGGSEYSRPGYSNSNISGTNIFYVYNIDGGDYNYVFNHNSTPGPRPTRTNYNLVCSTSTSTNEDGSTSTVTTCVCEPYTETYTGQWPHCPTGVVVSKNGGDKVQWQYEDGGGGNYDDQYVTVEVIGVRNAINDSSVICTSSLKNNVWVPDPTQAGVFGNCIGNYKNHGSKIRFRIPSLKASKTSLPDPVCYSAFRGVAGAIPPSEDLGTLSSEYSILHLFDDDFNVTTSLISGTGISVTPENLSDNVKDNLNTEDRRHYTIEFNDGTEVDEGAGNISVSVGQNITAGGVDVGSIIVSGKERVQGTTNQMKVWFYTSYQGDAEATDDIIHVFDDEEGVNQTDTELSKLSWPDVNVQPQSVNDDGSGTVNDINKKHYLITFNDGTIVGDNGDNIFIVINQRKTASGVSGPISVSKKEKVSSNSLRIWFTVYDVSKPPGEETNNTFVRDWSIQRTRPVDYSGNIFVRNWYLSKNV